MKKPLIITAVLLALVAVGGAAFFGGGVLRKSLGGPGNSVAGQAVSETAPYGQQSTRPAIVGSVKVIEGNELVIARVIDDPIAEMTDEEREARRQEMQKLSFEERQARRQQELQGLGTENVRVTIPVGIPVIKSIPGQGQIGAGEEASLEDIRVGVNVNIWTQGEKTNNATAEYVRITEAQR